MIFWSAYIVKGKGRLAHLGPNIYLDLGRTVGIMICMYNPIFSKGRYVVTDSVCEKKL